MLDNGISEVLSKLHTLFLISSARKLIKSVIWKGAAYKHLPSTPIPKNWFCEALHLMKRTMQVDLYQHSLYEKNKAMHKCWIFMFTCAGTWCLNLDLQASKNI